MIVSARHLAVVTAALAALALTTTACDDGDAPAVTEATRAVTPGATTIGRVDRLPNGTAVVTSDHTLVDIVCANGQLTMTTNIARFTGAMDCTSMAPPDIVQRYQGKPIAISITATRLKIDNPEAGSLDFPAANVTQEP
jgi:hypothetical protein